VAAFAHWGYTVGDPAAGEGERFFAGLNALGRLLAVGSEWGSYVAPIGGSAGRGLAREVAEEASEQLGRHSARQAAQQAAQQGNASESLPAPIRNSFRGVSYEEIKEPLIVYRLYGGKARQLGRWFMLQRPQGRLQATIDYAIRPEWEILSSGSLRYAFLEEPVSLLDLLPLKVDWLVEDYKCLCLRFKFALNGYYLM